MGFGYQILADRSWLLDPGYQIWDTRSWLPDPGNDVLLASLMNSLFEVSLWGHNAGEDTFADLRLCGGKNNTFLIGL